MGTIVGVQVFSWSNPKLDGGGWKFSARMFSSVQCSADQNWCKEAEEASFSGVSSTEWIFMAWRRWRVEQCGVLSMLCLFSCLVICVRWAQERWWSSSTGVQSSNILTHLARSIKEVVLRNRSETFPQWNGVYSYSPELTIQDTQQTPPPPLNASWLDACTPSVSKASMSPLPWWMASSQSS